MFKLSKTSLKRLEGVDPRWIEIIQLALEISTIDFGIPKDGGLRSAARQKQLYNDKVSLADGYSNPSYHQTGKAVDVFAYVDGKASWGLHHLAVVAAAMLQAASQLGYSIEWGGLWKSYRDYPHFQFPRESS